jgi:hypothetical protein
MGALILLDIGLVMLGAVVTTACVDLVFRMLGFP